MPKGIHQSCRAIHSAVLTVLLGSGASLAQPIPTPEQVLGFKVGADYHLATYEQAVQYFKELEKASPMMKVFEMGETSMGRTMIYAVITSQENMASLDRYKEISGRLALAKGLTDEEARRLASEGKAVVWIDAGIHATEVAPAQALLQFAYDLLTSKDADSGLILENTIVLLVFANPDGMTLVSEWYTANVGTPFETSPMPWLYHHYAGHDNNRDSYMNNLKETRNITRMVTREWHPVVLYDHHQTAPFPARIWIPPAAEPTNPNLHPLFIREKNLIGAAMGDGFDREGKEGAISRFVFDFIYPGYEDSFCDFFNVVSIMTETALYRYATPRFYTVEDFPEPYRDFTMGAFYPSPWKGGWWRLKDAVDYVNTGSKAVLHTAAAYRERFLFGRYLMGRDTIQKFRNEPPYAWIVPREQWDPPTAARMLDSLAFSGIEVHEAGAPFVDSGVSYPSQTWIVPMDQAFSRFVKAIFEEQTYPDLTKYPTLWQGIVVPQSFRDAYLPPYDMAGWTVPHQMGVEVHPASAPMNVPMTRLEKVVPPQGKVSGGAGYAYLISPRANNGFIAVNRILDKGGEVLRARSSFSAGGEDQPAGTFVVASQSIPKAFMDQVAGELSLTIRGTDSRVSAETYALKRPRIALYKSWVASIEEGWTRWLLEQYEFPHTNIFDAEIRAGELRSRFDVLIIPSIGSEEIIHGHEKGTIDPKYVGGVTEQGVRNIKRFVEEGGILIALSEGCFFALENLELPVGDALKGLTPPRRFYEDSPKAEDVKFACPGSVLRMEFNTEHPVAYGMPKGAPAMFYEGTAFNIIPSFGQGEPQVISRYPKGDLLMSGYLRGEEHLNNKAAAVDVPLGKGRVILLGFGVSQRAQPHGTFKILFNSLFYGSAMKEK